MTSRHKRALFQEKFGELLLPQGFACWEQKFVRIHSPDVLLGVDMDLSPSGSVYIQYEVLPFCAGIAFPLRGFSRRIPMGGSQEDASQGTCLLYTSDAADE